MSLSDWNVVLLGCGSMGSAIVRGAVDAGAIRAERVTLVDVDADKVSALAIDIEATEVDPITGGPTLWLVAVKPYDVIDALAAHEIAADDIVVSVAAGVRIDAIAEASGQAAIVRAMPNTPALIGKGVTGLFATDGSALAVARELFAAVGSVVELKGEAQFDAVTALSGSGPAYVFVAIEALADGGVLMGLDRETALELAIRTVEGAGALAAVDGAHPAQLKDRVASPGGTTIAGLDALERADFRGSLIAAVRAAAERSRELGED